MEDSDSSTDIINYITRTAIQATNIYGFQFNINRRLERKYCYRKSACAGNKGRQIIINKNNIYQLGIHYMYMVLIFSLVLSDCI